MQELLYVHAFSGGVALLTGAVALGSKKGGRPHKKAGVLYFWAMTLVFFTGVFIAGYQYNRFLLLIAFLSYYSVFCGLRMLKLKKLHLQQRPKWYDWTAGTINGIANLLFVGLGLYYLTLEGHVAAALLSVGFGSGGLLLSYTNLKPFVVKPDRPYHWYLAHIGNMTGGYIATFTAFTSTTLGSSGIIDPIVAFALPSLLGIPLLLYWTHITTKRFEAASNREI